MKREERGGLNPFWWRRDNAARRDGRKEKKERVWKQKMHSPGIEPGARQYRLKKRWQCPILPLNHKCLMGRRTNVACIFVGQTPLSSLRKCISLNDGGEHMHYNSLRYLVCPTEPACPPKKG
jgi:hypothetical protein